jgi:hypothetical protein
MKVKFYVGAMESDIATIFEQREEIHILTKLDYVVTAQGEKEVANIDALLRAADKEFIRSDSRARTFVELSILNELEVQP